MSGAPERNGTPPPAVDIVVIGAGINGAGIAREAAHRGVSVLVLEQADLASGTTSASTRLIHGGLRYLEHGELGLVRESLREREALLAIAPHLVEPLRLYLPIYRGARRPRWQIRVGMVLYDLLSRGKSLPNHAMLSREALLRRVPGLAAEGLVGGATYFDAQITYPERLVVENLLDAAAHGARVFPYTAATRIVADAGNVQAVDWQREDGVSGRTAAKCVINAAGPWLDGIAAAVEGAPPPAKALIDRTKGSHLIVAPFPGAPDAAVYAEAPQDGRPFFIVPWNGLYLIGTTDVRYEGDPGRAAIDRDERRYLLEATKRLFPQSGRIGERVLYAQAGVRALAYSPGSVEGAITRRHLIHAHRGATGLYSIVGGKLTTYRSLAGHVLQRLHRDRLLAARSGGHGPGGGRLPGAIEGEEREALAMALAEAFGPREVNRLLTTYGRLAERLLVSARGRPELAQPTVPGARALRVELVHAFEAEWATTLIDVLQRRVMLGLDADFGLGEAGAAARALVELGIWSDRRAAQELDAYRRYAAAHDARGLTSAEGLAPTGSELID